MPLLPLVLKFLKDNWFPITIAVTLMSVWIYIQILQSDVIDLESKLSKSALELNECKISIKKQNSVIKEWGIKSEKSQEEMEDLQRDIDQITKDANIKIQEILKRKSPKSCEETIEYFIDLGKQYK